jgi:ribosome-associated protein
VRGGREEQKGGGGAPPPPPPPTAAAAARAASSKQAQDIVVLNVSQLIVITDHFVICTAGSTRQIRSVVEEIERVLKEQLDVRPARREGEGGDAGWWLLDYIDVVVHVFGPAERAYYDLERLWRDAPRLEWEEPDAVSSAR